MSHQRKTLNNYDWAIWHDTAHWSFKLNVHIVKQGCACDSVTLEQSEGGKNPQQQTNNGNRNHISLTASTQSKRSDTLITSVYRNAYTGLRKTWKSQGIKRKLTAECSANPSVPLSVGSQWAHGVFRRKKTRLTLSDRMCNIFSQNEGIPEPKLFAALSRCPSIPHPLPSPLSLQKVAGIVAVNVWLHKAMDSKQGTNWD